MTLLPAPPSSSNPLIRRVRPLQRRSFVQFKGTPPVTHIETHEAQNTEFIGHTEADGAEQSFKPVSVGLTETEELEKYITIREEVYEKAKDFDSKIISFETAIRRPYFHMRPLNSVELENWTSYLDFIGRESDLTRDNRRFTFSLLDSKSRMGIYLVLKLPINLHILNSQQRFTVFDILGTITINVLTWVAAVV
ncbi:hypothetical protein DVH24_026297 [Malus domestica]|uniref:Uncharacterized protein n=1 Tax=Malus domestica TaxID=3750 RepID=A0A498KJ09_MALDO|nr:hypothetical protein DVH24_026297 [Malus domestica]